MPKSRSRRSKKGGFLEGLFGSSQTNTGYGSQGYGSQGYGSQGYGSQGYGATQGSSWNPFSSSKPSSGYGSQGYGSSDMGSSGYGMGSSGYPSSGMGGKRRRGMRGGSVRPNMSLTNLASSAAPISGGRTRRRRHRHTKSCKKSCKKC
jgi:hypothetical protein